MLVGLGLANLAAASGARRTARAERSEGVASAARPVVVGFVHGLAGSAFVAMLVLGAIDGPLERMLYLVLFGVGTTAGMTLVTCAIALPAGAASARMEGLQGWIRFAAGAVSLVFGLALAHEIGVVDGLFSTVPRWSPK